MHRIRKSPAVRIGFALALLVPALLLAPPRPAQATVKGPCGEVESLPGPGHYSGGFKGTLVRIIKLGFTTQELSSPVGGLLEMDIDEAGHVTGQAGAQFPGNPISGGLDTKLDGQLPEPLVNADVPARGQAQVGLATGFSGPLSLSGDTVLHFRDFKHEFCVDVQGSWTIEKLANEDPAGHWELRDAQWGAKLVGANEDVEREIRGGVGMLANLPPAQALGLPDNLTREQADATIEALVAGTAAPPSGGLFELYQKAQAAPAPAAQVRCLTELVETVISLKLQEYIAGGATPAYEEAARYGNAVKLIETAGAGPDCAAYTGGKSGLHDLIGAVMQGLISAGTDVDGVTHLTREAKLFGFDDLYQLGKTWLATKGVAV
jgi:hypothetical protein